MPPDIRPMCFGAPDFLSCPLVNDSLESRRAHPACLMGAAETHLPPNRPHPDNNHPRRPPAPLGAQALVFSAGLGGKGESADRVESRPRSKIARVKFPGYIEPGDVQNTITTMFGGNMYENTRNDSTTLWSPDPESFSGLCKCKSHCDPEYAPRARSPIG